MKKNLLFTRDEIEALVRLVHQHYRKTTSRDAIPLNILESIEEKACAMDDSLAPLSGEEGAVPGKEERTSEGMDFWEALVSKLSQRDLRKRFSNEEWKNLSHPEREVMIYDVEQPYWEEFRKNGVKRLFLIHSPNES